MKFERFFVGITYAVAALGFLAIAIDGQAGPITWAGMLGALVASQARFRRFAPSESMWRVLSVAFLLLVAARYALFARPLLVTAQDLLIFLQINRLFTRSRNQDYAHIYLLAFLQILLACILTFSPIFAVILFAFMIFTAWALMFLQLKIGMDAQHVIENSTTVNRATENRAAGKPGLPAGGRGSRVTGPGFWLRRSGGRRSDSREARTGAGSSHYRRAEALLGVPFLAAFGGAALLMLVGTITLFFLTPRMEISLFRRQAGPSVHVAGFSDEVELGEVGRILTSRQRVMRAKLQANPDLAPSIPYWRGMGLDHFDGKRWSLSLSYRSATRTRSSSFSGELPRGTNMVQRYSVEALDSSVIFGMYSVLEIESALPRLEATYTSSYESLDHVGRMDYVVYSQIPTWTPDELRQHDGSMPPALARVYLQLPPMSPDVEALASRIVQEAGASNAYDKARAIERYLRHEYQYTLNPESQGRAPLEDFLFRKKSGHCEYFASAMVVLSRAAGLPARLVNGFMGGELNPVGDYYIVRQEDAHSWAELWFGKYGWMRFDATPAGAAANARPEKDLLSQVGYLADYLQMQWYYFVLDYDLNAQIELLSAISPSGSGSSPRNPFRRSKSRSSSKYPYDRILMATGGGLLIALLLFLRKRRVRERSQPELETPFGRKFLKYRRMLHRELGRQGFEKTLSETPLERAERAARSLRAPRGLTGIETTYYAARYGHQKITERDLERARRMLEGVRRAGRAG